VKIVKNNALVLQKYSLLVIMQLPCPTVIVLLEFLIFWGGGGGERFGLVFNSSGMRRPHVPEEMIRHF